MTAAAGRVMAGKEATSSPARQLKYHHDTLRLHGLSPAIQPTIEEE